ncbi:hypothetical protein, partial [Promineifilum sp.]|uniref:hypothetical protein n=1 Tax=Promineifilum sp. TaxID=2664178 RepID=UPI0035B48E7F
AAAGPAGAAAAAAMATPAPSAPPKPAAPGTPEAVGTVTRPPVPSGVGEYFLPINLGLRDAATHYHFSLPAGSAESGILYRPALLAQAEVRLTNARYKLDTRAAWAALAPEPDPAAALRWEDIAISALDDRALDRAPIRDARFASLSAPLADAKQMRALEADFTDWIVRHGSVDVRVNETLKVYAGPDVDDAQFEEMCRDAGDDRMQAELDKVKARFETRLRSAQEKLQKEERELAQDKAEYDQRKGEEYAKHAETLLSIFGGRRKSLSGSMSKRRMTANAKADIEESEQTIVALQEQLGGLKEELEVELDKIEARWDAIMAETKTMPVAPRKSDVRVALFGVAWQPHYLVTDASGRALEIPAYK